MHFVVGRVTRSEGALAQIRDIAWIAARGDVDWAQLLDVSRRFGVADRVRLALAVTDRLGLLPESAALPALTREDAARAERFAASSRADRPRACAARLLGCQSRGVR